MNAKPELPEEVKGAESPEKKKRRWLALALAVAMILAVWKFWLPYWGINAQALRQMPRLHQGDYTQEVAVFSGQSKSVATSGCGAVCMAMAISYLRHTQVSPQDLFAWAYDQGFYYGDGLGHEALTAMAEKYGLHSQWIDNDQDRCAPPWKRDTRWWPTWGRAPSPRGATISCCEAWRGRTCW